MLLLADGWKFDGRTTSGLRWYTRTNADAGTSEVLATAVIKARADDVWAVLNDYDGYVKSMPSTAAASVLERDGADVAWVYLRYTLPFMADRDTVVRMESLEPLDGGVRLLSWRADGDSRKAAAPPIVRLRVNSGSWKVESRNGGRSAALTYQLKTGSAGGIPAAFKELANRVAIPQTFERVSKAANARSP